MDKSKDSEFENIDELKWLPYIGDNYFNSDKKVLIIGESHYREDNEKSKKWNDDKTFTRDIHSNIAIAKDYTKTKFFHNLNRALFRNDKRIDTTVLWNKLAFYNFVQSSMRTRESRPNQADYLNGWIAFFTLTSILNPEFCLFIGVEASNYIKKAISTSNYKIKSCIRFEKIHNTFPREIILEKPEGKELKLLFIKHTSQFFSWDKWNSFMKSRYENELNWLKSGIWVPKNHTTP